MRNLPTQLFVHGVVFKILFELFLYFCSKNLDVNAIMGYVKWQNNGISQGHGYLGPNPCSYLMVFKLRVNEL